MELVYPIYTDLVMMQAFLASLEGGLQDDTLVEDKTGGSKDLKASANVKAGLSSLLSWVTSASASLDLSGETSHSDETVQKYTRSFPSEALFIRLREILLKEDMIKKISTPESLQDIQLGDLIEITGKASAEPGYKLRNSLGQLAPLLSEFSKLTQKQNEANISLVKNAKIGETILIEGENIHIADKQVQNFIKTAMEVKKTENAGLMDQYASFSQILNSLMPDAGISSVIFECTGFSIVSRIYDKYIRDGRIGDIHNASWRCIGKVIEVSDEGVDLLNGMPISFLAAGTFSDLSEAFNSDDMKIDIGGRKTEGKTIILASLAIFA
jgi:hypothetical protein